MANGQANNAIDRLYIRSLKESFRAEIFHSGKFLAVGTDVSGGVWQSTLGISTMGSRFPLTDPKSDDSEQIFRFWHFGGKIQFSYGGLGPWWEYGKCCLDVIRKGNPQKDFQK
jgi:hypothetical protein